ncbi:IDEAL domain-containing protein [Peribacillus alkalitolerans]|uniref:IDEAL domain-containing protein n=1 Tax=Peribacillus alkalitolerans TaxID=1550385 RepID=UPI0013D0202E|nr:IDEAL domain-containing protein [Peribacillus alkalitolerans]
MNNDKSYSEQMKSAVMNKKQQKEAYIQNLLIEMVIHESILKYKKEMLLKEIDEALDQKNQDRFLKFSSELNQVLKQFGN